MWRIDDQLTVIYLLMPTGQNSIYPVYYWPKSRSWHRHFQYRWTHMKITRFTPYKDIIRPHDFNEFITITYKKKNYLSSYNLQVLII